MDISQNDIVLDGVSLFKEVFKKDILANTFKHKHFDNPMKLESPGLVEKKNGSPIGMHWMMRQEFQYGQKKLLGVQGSDDAIISSERGGFVFLKLRMTSVKVMKEYGTDFEFGCFAKGEALQIAEQFGENEVVDLYLARLYLKEKTHRWKRFDIKYPSFISNLLYKKRIKKIENIKDKNCDITVTNSCPFTNEDFIKINSSTDLHSVKNQDFYNWKLGNKNADKIKFIVAREKDELLGYIVFDANEKAPSIIDWDIFSEDKIQVLATLVSKCVGEYEYIDIPYLNIARGEMELFKALGCKDMSKLWACSCICVKKINEDCDECINKPELWKLRLIDADYYLNT